MRLSFIHFGKLNFIFFFQKEVFTSAVVVNFMCSFTGPQDAQMAGQTLLWVYQSGYFWM